MFEKINKFPENFFIVLSLVVRLFMNISKIFWFNFIFFRYGLVCLECAKLCG